MSPFSRLLFSLVFLLLVLAVVVYVLFPQNLPSEQTLEILGRNNPELLEDYRNQRAVEGQARLWIFLVGLLGITLLLTLYYYAEFVRPVFRLSRTLAARDIPGLEGWTRSRSEFGKLAKLLARYLREANMLQDEIRRSKLVLSDTEKTWVLEAEQLDREKLGRDLHDGVIQSVYGIGLQLGALRKRMAGGGVGVSQSELQYLEEALGQVVKDIRGLIINLEPGGLRDGNLETALRELKKGLSRIRNETFDLEVEPECLTDMARDLQSDLYLAVRELVSNALKHSSPGRMLCRLSGEGGGIQLQFSNDGVPGDSVCARGSGLNNIEDRLKPYGGTVQVEHNPAENSFLVTLKIPQSQREQHETDRVTDS